MNEITSNQFLQSPVLEAMFNPSLPFSDALRLSRVSKAHIKGAQPYFESVAKVFGITYRDRAEMMEKLKKSITNLDGTTTIHERIKNYISSMFIRPEAPGPINRAIQCSLVELKQRKKDRDLLRVANVIGKVLGMGPEPFSHVDEARAYLNDPNNQGALASITLLNLSDCGLSFLPPEIGKLVDLRELDVSHNQLSSLPPEIGKLVDLRELDVSHNQLTTLPREIGKLVFLRVLAVSCNQLTLLPPEIGKLVQLLHLGAFDNQLTSLPPEIGKFVQLRWLGVSHNQLTSLPPEIGKLVDLRELDVSHNQLTTLPCEIEKLVFLRGLYVSDNQLTSLPPRLNLRLLPLSLRWLILRQAAEDRGYEALGSIGDYFESA